ncbi:amidohydrolase [Solwaraspora sp. WMMB762]|uniref:amidohydrolase n=1 Tax=Solwaraspora sp. WMMB762 TaxID=3404120 RepID=UPI003B92976D
MSKQRPRSGGERDGASPEAGRDALKAAIAAAIDRDAGGLTALGEDIFAHPELAYHEFRTADVVAGELRRLGLTVEEGLARTGVRARLRGRGHGPTVCVLAELDAIPTPGHPAADPVTGAAHSCGHHAQVAHLVGVARALTELAAGELVGDVLFFAVPAEEYSDIDRAGAPDVEFPGGKQELIRLGCFDGVDLAMMAHALGTGEPRDGAVPARPLGMTWQYTGFATRRATFRGRAAHASTAAGDGVDALGAARIALHAIDTQRESFADGVRVHPVLRPHHGTLNVVADRAEVDVVIRGRTEASIVDAGRRIDRALRAGAFAVGAGVELTTAPGYHPLSVDRALGDIFRANAVRLAGPAAWSESEFSAASTDAGDLSTLLPVLHATHGGCAGVNHSASFRIVDPIQAYVQPAIALAWTVVDLLGGTADAAHHAVAAYRPRYTRSRYVETLRAVTRRRWYPPPAELVDGGLFDGQPGPAYEIDNPVEEVWV